MLNSANTISRRSFLRQASAGAAAAAGGGLVTRGLVTRVLGAAGEPGPSQGSIEVGLPRLRVPLSFIIDDSTCLVNMGHYCMPQFAAAWPDREAYRKPWKSWPREIPDDFVREFGNWCGEHGVKGKYSIVPYPACVGWLDRELPGWSRAELQASLQLVRDLMLPNWDIHPEMITHTRVIDLKTGRPLPEISSATMENSYPQSDQSVDELAAYLAYALQVLKNCELPCEGVTTPGGFGNRVKSNLSLAVQQAVRDVYQTEIPHYFKYVRSGDESTQPTLEHVSQSTASTPNLTVNVPAGTGDWFGSWDGDSPPEGHRYANAEATEGRMVELIERGEPAVMLCHWPGMYCHGSQAGFQHFQAVVVALEQRYADRTLWMKPSEMARYWAARQLTQATRDGQTVQLQAPFACPDFTLKIPLPAGMAVAPRFASAEQEPRPLQESRISDLSSGRWVRDGDACVVCLNLPRGLSRLEL